jgi:hypothetical protein
MSSPVQGKRSPEHGQAQKQGSRSIGGAQAPNQHAVRTLEQRPGTSRMPAALETGHAAQQLGLKNRWIVLEEAVTSGDEVLVTAFAVAADDPVSKEAPPAREQHNLARRGIARLHARDAQHVTRLDRGHHAGAGHPQPQAAEPSGDFDRQLEYGWLVTSQIQGPAGSGSHDSAGAIVT